MVNWHDATARNAAEQHVWCSVWKSITYDLCSSLSRTTLDDFIGTARDVASGREVYDFTDLKFVIRHFVDCGSREVMNTGGWSGHGNCWRTALAGLGCAMTLTSGDQV
jgi:hypothetical protein